MGRHQDSSLSPWSEYHHREARPPWLTLASGPSRSRSGYLVVQGSPALNHVISIAGHRSPRPQVNWDVTQAGHSIPSALRPPPPGSRELVARWVLRVGSHEEVFLGLAAGTGIPKPHFSRQLVWRAVSPWGTGDRCTLLLVAAQQHIPTPKFIKNEVLAHLPRWITASLSWALLSSCVSFSLGLHFAPHLSVFLYHGVPTGLGPCKLTPPPPLLRTVQ